MKKKEWSNPEIKNAGNTQGIAIEINVLIVPHPSTSAASNNSFGIFLKN